MDVMNIIHIKIHPVLIAAYTLPLRQYIWLLKAQGKHFELVKHRNTIDFIFDCCVIVKSDKSKSFIKKNKCCQY
jgi:hypothetical protein